MHGVLKVWLWISIVTAVAGAVLLYPIGPVSLNVLFILIKIGMVTGLVIFLRGNKDGFVIWCCFSAGAVLMTLFKWIGTGKMTPLFIIAIVADILMPTVAYFLKKSN
ncbi:MAG: hypothetical protein LKE40_03330 [Spirochaetia bacterium]|jgi:hypothetical protein|nr:hypothetical protein [Spirochaetia bacterium]